MKRLISKYTIGAVLISFAVSILYAAATCLLTTTFLKRGLSPLRNSDVAALIGAASAESNSRRIGRSLDEFSARTGIVPVVSLFNGAGEPLEYRGAGFESAVRFLSVSFPILKHDERTGTLRLLLSPDTVVRKAAQTGVFWPLAAWFFGWWVLLLLAIFAYLRRDLLSPLQRLLKSFERIDRNEFVPIDADAYAGRWRDAASALNGVIDRLSGTGDTLHMLFSVSRALTSRLEINEISSMLMDIIMKKYEGVSCAVILLGEDGFLRVSSQRNLSPEFVRSLRLRPGEGFVGQAFQKCQTVIVNDARKQTSMTTSDLVEKEQIASFIHVPLEVDSRCRGTLSVNSRVSEFFTPERIATIATLAEYLSIAMRNVELYGRIQELNQRLETEVTATTRELIQTNSRLIQKVREMKALSDIAAFAAAKANLSEILEMIVDKIKELLSTQSAGFFLYAPETNEMIPYPPFFGIRDKEFSRLRFKLDEIRTIESVLREGKSCVFNDARQAHDALPLLVNLLSIHTLVLVPLRSGKKTIGVLGVANKFGAAFNQDDVRILELIADRISGIIDNVTLYQELEHRLHDLTALQEISSAISSEPVLGKTLNQVISTATQAFKADLCALLLFDAKTKELVTQPGAFFTGGDEAVAQRIPVGDPNSLSAQVFRGGEPFISPDASIDPRIKSQTARLWDVRSLILVPLRAENRVIGVLRIGRHQANCYTRDHLRLATLIAHQAAVIIENAHLYESLKEAKIEQERLNQVKNEFLSIVSHELRTPITTIKGFIKVILRGEAGTLNSQQEKFLQIADQATDRLILLISDLLDISRIESGQIHVKLMPLDPAAVIDDVLKIISPELNQKGLKLERRLSDSLPPVMADRERLVQVLDNLIINGIKFTPAGGTISVSAEDKGDYVFFGIRDSGIGIAEKDQHRIFEKFYQVDSGPTRAIAGAGLGLAIVKSIVELHGGRVWVESKAGEGSLFTFIIPRAKTEIQDFRLEQGDANDETGGAPLRDGAL